MSLIYNGTTIKKLIYNGTSVQSATYNGTKVFSSAIIVTKTITIPFLYFSYGSSFSTTNSYINSASDKIYNAKLISYSPTTIQVPTYYYKSTGNVIYSNYTIDNASTTDYIQFSIITGSSKEIGTDYSTNSVSVSVTYYDYS